MSHDISRLQADVATLANYVCSSLWGPLSLCLLFFFVPSFRPPCPILLSSVSCCSLSCCLRVLFLHTLSSLSFLLSVVVASLSCALRCRGMRTCQRMHASLLHYYCKLLTTNDSDLAHGMCMECRISPRVHRRNVLRVPAEHLCPWCRWWHLY